MGTRHFIGVVYKGEFKVAQYGQWDGYVSGQGKKIVQFLSSADLNRFKLQIDKCRWITTAELNAKWAEFGVAENAEFVGCDISEKFGDVNPLLHRDCGANLFSLIEESDDNEILLQDASSVVHGDTWIEFAYVIDLDNEVLEVYSNRLDKDAVDGNRFSAKDDTALSLAGVYHFDHLDLEKIQCDAEPE
jgi:hypothetical protein